MHENSNNSDVPQDLPFGLPAMQNLMSSESLASLTFDARTYFFEQMLDALPTQIFFKNRESRFVFVNESFAKMIGIKKQECLGKTDRELFSPLLAEKYMADDKAVLEGEESTISDDIIYSSKGERRFVQVSKIPLRCAPSEQVVGVCCIFTDITEFAAKKEELDRKEMDLGRQEATLRRAEAALLQLQHNEEGRPLKVFISYRHTDKAHVSWVRQLATDLIEVHCVPCILDQFDLSYGDSIPAFMQRIKTEASHVLFVITPETVAAVERNMGGVSFEAQLAAARRDEGGVRFVPLLRAGSDTPAYVRAHLYVDFRDDGIYRDMLKRLADSLLGRHQRPLLGSRADQK